MKILAKVQYLGTKFYGWQKQIDTPTVQEEIEKVLSKILDYEVNIYGSGRTDAGVHAKGQTFHFELKKDFDLNKLKYAFNSLICDDIHIDYFKVVNEDFHARFSATGKHYCYYINLKEKTPFNYQTSLYYPYPFDEDLFTEALRLFVGKHDFRNFTSKEEDEKNFMRNIYMIEVMKEEFIEVHFYGDGFMRYMIRNVIGTALAVASKKENLNYISSKLDTKERDITSHKANSEGLCLLDVMY